MLFKINRLFYVNCVTPLIGGGYITKPPDVICDLRKVVPVWELLVNYGLVLFYLSRYVLEVL